MLFDQLRQDLDYAARQLVKAPTLTVVMISMLALGIGANSALFSVLDRLVSRPAPGIGASDDLVKLQRHIYQEDEGRFSAARLSYPEFLDFRAQRAAFADLAIERRVTLGVRAQDVTSPVRAFMVSSSYFSLLRVQMTLGTGLPRDDDAHPAVQALGVVSHRFWQQRLAGAPDAIGQRIDVNGVPFTVVGVAPPLFHGVELDENPVDLRVPIGAVPLLYPEASAALTDRDSTHYSAIALVQPGVTREMATQVATVTAQRMLEAHPPRQRYARTTVELRSATIVPREGLGEAVLLTSWVGGTPVWLTLLVVCTNVSSLLLGRAVMRRNEIAVRLSLGAARARVIRQLLTESMLLALLGSAAGLLLLLWAISYFQTQFPIQLDIPIQWRTVGFTIGSACVVGALFGVMPALHAARTGVFDALKNSSGVDRRGARLQRRFVVAQLTLSLPLLVAAGWYLTGLQQLVTTAPEFASDRALGVTLDLHLRRYTTPQADALLTAARTRIAALPGVQGAAFATNVPFFSSGAPYFFQSQPRSVRGDMPLPPGARLRGAGASTLDPDYLRLMRIPILRGRGIESTDHAGAPAVAVVNEDYARAHWPGEDPLGKPLYTMVRRDTAIVEMIATVVGVAGPQARRVTGNEDAPHVYVARQQFPEAGSITLVVRTSMSAAPLLGDIRRELERLDAQLPLRGLGTFERRVVEATDVERKVARYSLLAGLLVLLMASVGVYAVIAFNVAQRTREIGIRMALGARASQVAISYVREGLRLAIFGIIIGVPAVLLMRLGFSQLLYNLEAATETLAIVVVVLTLMGVVALASWLPARRAARVNPMDALRTD